MEVAVPLEIDQEGVRWLIKVLRDEDASADKVLLRRLHRSVLYKDMGWRVRDKGLIFHPHTNTNTPRSEQAAYSIYPRRGRARFQLPPTTLSLPCPGSISRRGVGADGICPIRTALHRCWAQSGGRGRERAQWRLTFFSDGGSGLPIFQGLPPSSSGPHLAGSLCQLRTPCTDHAAVSVCLCDVWTEFYPSRS